MGEGSPNTSRPTRNRPVTLPPPRIQWAEEIASLEEVGAELAIVFWRVLRKVREWAETPPEAREGLFGLNKSDARERLGAACREVPELVEPFGIFALLIRAPHVLEPWLLADACHQVHEWAEERSFVLTAMFFAEAAATADPESPARANDAGRMCRRASRDDRASSWYHRAFGLGVRHKARQETIRAQLGYGNLMKDLGEYDEARKYYEKAAQRAINTGRKRQAGEAYHSLLTIAAERGEYQQGRRYVKRALDLYPIRYFRIPALVHDWAVVLIRVRHFTPAIHLLDLVLPRFQSPEVLTVVWGNLARALAGARRQDRFDKAEREVLHLVEQRGEFAASALNSLATGAWSFGRWNEAERYATAALNVARERREGGEYQAAEYLLTKLASRQVPPVEEDAVDRESLEALVRRCEARLKIWKAPGKDQPGAYPGVL